MSTTTATRPTAPAEADTVFGFHPVAPPVGATGRDKISGPVISMDDADRFLATRRPFRTPYRENPYSDFAGRSVRAELYRVTRVARPEYAPASVILAPGYGEGMDYGSAPAEVRALLLADLADAWASDDAAGDLHMFIVWSYGTPVAWGLHRGDYDPRSGALLTVPDVRYSLTTTQHQTALLSAYVVADDPYARPASRLAPGVDYMRIGRRVDVGVERAPLR